MITAYLHDKITTEVLSRQFM